jgi:hypothetical protein
MGNFFQLLFIADEVQAIISEKHKAGYCGMNYRVLRKDYGISRLE